MSFSMSFRFVGLPIILLLLALALPGVAQADDLASRIKQVEAKHPRLFFNAEEEAALKAKIESDPLLQATFQYLLACADNIFKNDTLVYKKTGKRLLSVSRSCMQRVSYLSLAYRLTKEERYLKRAQEEMLAVSAFENWNPTHFLDVAEMTTALAVGYDWLYNDLDPQAREIIQSAILEKGLRTSLKGGRWISVTNNWNQVCHGGLSMGALAVLEADPELAQKILARAIEKLPLALHEYEPDGVYPEGPSYWKYGTSYNVLLLAALESVLGSDFGLASAKGFMKSPDFYLQATGPSGMFFNFSDCGSRGSIAPAMYWFAQHKEKPGLLYREKEELAAYVQRRVSSSGSGDRFLAFLLIWAQPFSEMPVPEQCHWKGDGRTPVAMHRSAWDSQATFLGIKGGSPGSNHAHMDTGSFVLDMAGMRWALDLGAQSYHSLESKGINLWSRRQESERWTVFRLNNFSHNTLVVDEKLQLVKGNGPILRFSGEATNAFSIVDMTPVYEGQVKQAHRGARLIGESVLIQDEVMGLDATSSVRWGMATNAAVELLEGQQARLTQGDKHMVLEVLSPKNISLVVLDMENPPRDYDVKNMNTRMIAFETELAANTSETLAVFMRMEEDATEAPVLKKLAEW